MAKKKTAQAPEILELDYQLAELPSSQHRAGLAGLVFMVNWLERMRTKKGICKITRLDQYGATLSIDQQGLEALFDEVYAASKEEREEPKLRTSRKSKDVIPPMREITREVTRRGKTQTKTFYVYPVIRPRGAFLTDYDPTAKGEDGAWVELWREMYFKILRGRDKQRIPFKARANRKKSDDTIGVWEDLCQAPGHSVDMPSTFFVGAQDSNAENVPFLDQARFLFLLHFWTYAAQIYLPRTVNNKWEARTEGYALAIPDIADLAWFCEELPVLLRNRGTDLLYGFRPKDSVIDLAAEGALDLLVRLRDRLAVLEGERVTGSLILGVDVIHLDKPSNNVEIKGIVRVDPDAQMIDEYARIQRSLWNPIFRHQCLLNLVNRRPWYFGFDKLLSRLPHKELFAEVSSGFKYFRHDVREHFESEDGNMEEKRNTENPINEESVDFDPSKIGYESLIYKMTGSYLRRKLESKNQLTWSTVKGDPDKEAEYQQKKRKLAREAFLAVRGRYEQDFIDYFASTLCSVPQSMSEGNFVAFTQALFQETDRIRTLTMLALSARS